MTGRRSISSLLAVFFAFLAIALAPIRAQEAILLEDGRHEKGWVIADNGHRITFEIDTGGQGDAQAEYDYDQLSPRTIYRLMLARTPRDDGAGQLTLAKSPLEHGFLGHARIHYPLAEEASKDHGPAVDAGLRQLRVEGAKRILAYSKQLIKEKNYRKAQR